MGIRLYLQNLDSHHLHIPLLMFTHDVSTVVSSFSQTPLLLISFRYLFLCCLFFSISSGILIFSFFPLTPVHDWEAFFCHLEPLITYNPTWLSVPLPVFPRFDLYIHPLSSFSSVPYPQPVSCLSETLLAVPVAAFGESSVTAVTALLVQGTAFTASPTASRNWLESQGPSQVCVAASASRELLLCRFCRCNLTWADE